MTEKPLPTLRSLRLSIVMAIVILTVQGLTGNLVNLFAPFPGGSVGQSFGGLTTAISNAGVLTAFHAFEGALLITLSLVVLGLSFRSKDRSLQILSTLATGAVISAMVGGVLFVLSGFQNNADSAQMGGSFIGAYAFYLFELYFAK